jgi:hypothetical protein
VDGCGLPWTRLGDLRIRRLGVRVPPGVPRKPLHREGFVAFGLQQLQARSTISGSARWASIGPSEPRSELAEEQAALTIDRLTGTSLLLGLALQLRIRAAAVAYSRVHTGIHYPAGVAGSVVGGVIGNVTAPDWTPNRCRS